MNREEAKDLIHIMQAFVEGKQIQFLDLDKHKIWIDINNPSFGEGVQYRIKPEPREWYIEVDKVQGEEYIMHRMNPASTVPQYKTSEIIKVREVIE